MRKIGLKKVKNVLKSKLAARLNISERDFRSLAANKSVVTARTSIQDVSNLVASLKPVEDPSIPLVRLGPEGDGGYLVPDDLNGISVCFSPGVSHVSGFEQDCADRGMQVYLADYSVEGPALENSRFHFTKKFVGALDSANYLTLDKWASQVGQDNDSELILQMDIEGAEYESLLNVSSEFLQRCRVIVIELHALHELWNRQFYGLASTAIAKLLQTHTCVHIHPNNCCGSLQRYGLDLPRVCEFTFLRNDRLGEAVPAKSFPHPLDRDNTRRPTLPLPTCWYS
ncbi:hypothetical protein EY643_01545 [Halioglobus maricola]|uniref:Methyltransferase FkbM domain-containing protein n=1 Tax=Halioglobus maricola TaxID=2601894 RepID=A0A5P9NF88_9GAMM|nr:FkbM family methyltransferase [Halioglobus maricola]QFU74441.1 hypothetical protein EY643_01545 [Halioglobus maricola]